MYQKAVCDVCERESRWFCHEQELLVTLRRQGWSVEANPDPAPSQQMGVGPHGWPTIRMYDQTIVCPPCRRRTKKLVKKMTRRARKSVAA